MDFFNKLSKKASEAYKVTADKTGKIAKETKLKLKMNELKSQINDIYEEIGKKVYEKHIREEEISIKDDLEESCTKIDVLSDEIDDILKQCLDLKDKKICPKCYTEIEKQEKFCHICGEKQTEDTPKQVEILEDIENTEIEEDNKTEEETVKEDNDKEFQENLQKTVAIEADVDIKENNIENTNANNAESEEDIEKESDKE